MSATVLDVIGLPSCSVGDCDNPVKARGWCNKHYLRWWFHGDPLATVLIRDDDQTRFWAKVAQPSPDACWEWLFARDKDGYGSVWFQGKQCRAPRVAWVLATGSPIPDGQMIRHRCDNPPCVNPTHLELGTSQQNDHDRVERQRAARGPGNSSTKLTEAAVRTIRSDVASGMTHRATAARHQVTKATVTSIIAGRIWGWVE